MLWTGGLVVYSYIVVHGSWLWRTCKVILRFSFSFSFLVVYCIFSFLDTQKTLFILVLNYACTKPLPSSYYLISILSLLLPLLLSMSLHHTTYSHPVKKKKRKTTSHTHPRYCKNTKWCTLNNIKVLSFLSAEEGNATPPLLLSHLISVCHILTCHTLPSHVTSQCTTIL